MMTSGNSSKAKHLVENSSLGSNLQQLVNKGKVNHPKREENQGSGNQRSSEGNLPMRQLNKVLKLDSNQVD